MDESGEGRGGGWDRGLAGSFSGEALLDGEWEALGLEDERDRAIALHHGLISLRSGLASVELRLGELFAHFAPGGRFTFEPLGAASREAGCQARFGISWALARQFIDLARAFVSLPLSREAFLLALVERSKLRWLVKVATAQTEAGWLALAKRRGEHQFSADVRAFQERKDEASPAPGWAWPDLPEPEPYPREYVRLTGSPAQAAAVRSWGFDVMRKIVGEDRLAAWECMEALCADAAAGLDIEYPDLPDDDAERSAGVRAVKVDEAKLRELAVTWRVQRVAKPLELPQVADDADFDDVFRALVRCVRLRDRALAERATLLYWLDGCSLWRHLGAKSLVAYAARALGMPPKDLREGLRLRARLSMLPQLRKGWLRGVVPSLVARRLVNIAAQDTEEEWISHVERLTGKRLDAETRWQDLALHSLDLATWRKTTDGGRPQPSLGMHDLRQGIETMAQRCVQDLDGDAPEVRAVVERPALTSFGFWAPPHIAALVRTTLNEVRAGMGPAATDGDAILKLTDELLALVALDKPELSREMQINREVFERDGWQCANPLCRARRNLHAHHVVFRSHGGCDEKWNKVALCVSCHLRLLHLGFLRITRARPAPAEDLIFELPEVGERWQEGVLLQA